MTPLTLTPLTGIPFIRQSDDLADILINALQKSNISLEENDILVLTQKIVSKAEGRFVNLDSISPKKRARELAVQTEKDPRLIELILHESNAVLRKRPGVIIVEHKLGFICANAGFDHSIVGSPSNDSVNSKVATEVATKNTQDWVLLLPEDPSKSAQVIHKKLESKTGRKIGVMIIDSHGRSWRIGTVGMCIGLSGLPAIIDERGWKDLFGYTLKATVVGTADELAAAASLVMGQAAEGTPAVHVRGFPYPLKEGLLKELIRPKEQDLFR
jgi:coenzyme F420-0:L-glutamate ligase/coenzyme F420-1:gamma-L-glutamate ligase